MPINKKENNYKVNSEQDVFKKEKKKMKSTAFTIDYDFLEQIKLLFEKEGFTFSSGVRYCLKQYYNEAIKKYDDLRFN